MATDVSPPKDVASPAIVVLVFLAAVLALVVASPAGAAAPREQLTPVVGNPIASPEPVLASDGRRELAYELQLINRTESTVTVRKLEAIAGGKVAETLSGKALEAVMAPHVAERFAIDFVQIDPLGRLFEGPLGADHPRRTRPAVRRAAAERPGRRLPRRLSPPPASL